jgi:stage II sporulation protein D
MTSREGRLVLDGVEQAEPQLELRPKGSECSVDDRAYQGGLLVKAGSEGRLTVFNLLEPEQYLRSVVGSEMYSGWPLETLMAQAVAARTFMVYTLSTKGYLSRVDMAYRGVAGESAAADLATELTRGIVLTYHDRILPAYFTNTCGGRTVPVEKVFAMEPAAPLGRVKCDWCRESPSYEWTAEIPGAQIAERLGDARISTVSSIKTEGAEPDGYARFVVINGEVRLGAHAFGLAVGSELIKSACFTVTERDGQFRFEGRGSGHGVGLCQWGARGMAEAGKSWMDILLCYYPEAALQKAY